MVYTHSLKQGVLLSKGSSSLQYVHLIRPSSTTSSTSSKTTSIKASSKDSFHASLAQSTMPKSVLTVPRPPAAYGLFKKENYAKVKLEHPKAKGSELSKLLSKRWNAGTEKEEYTKKAQNLQKDYEQKLAATLDLRKKLKPLVHGSANAYNLFLKEKAVSMKGMKNRKEAMDKIAAQWKSLSPEQKQKYVTNAAKLQKEVSDRKAKLTAAEMLGLREMTIETRMNRLKRLGRTSRRKELHNLAVKFNRPKQPAVGIAAFGKQHMATLPKGKKLDVKTVAEKWNAMPASEKQKWLEGSKSATAQYKKNLAAWEEKMTKAGHKDVVSKFHDRKWKSFLPEGVKMPKTIKQHILEAKQRTSLQKKRQAKAKRASALKAKKQLKLQKQRKIAAARRERLQKKKASALARKKALVEHKKALKAKKVALKLKKAMAAMNSRAIRKLRLQKQKAAALKTKKTMSDKKKQAALKKKSVKKVLAKKPVAVKAKKAAKVMKKAKLAFIRGSRKRVIMKKAKKVAKQMQKVKLAASKKLVSNKAKAAAKRVASKRTSPKK